MRFIGFILVISGLAAALGYPYYHQAFTNFEIGQYTIYDPVTGFENKSIWLTPDDAPIRLTFEGDENTNERVENADTAFELLVTDQNAKLLLRETIRLTWPITSREIVNNQPAKTEMTADVLQIGNGAIYNFAFDSFASAQEPLGQVSMKVTGKVSAANDQIPTIGYGMAGFGVFLFLFGGRRKNKSVGNAPMGQGSKASRIGRRADQVTRSPKEPEKQKHKWGREE